jgi:hypothetical protein
MLLRPSPSSLRSLLCGALFTLLAALLAPAAHADALQAPEYRIKAAFLMRFCRYVEWPPHAFATPDAPLVVGVLEADALADELAPLLQGERDGGRALTLRRLRRGDSLQGLHVLFVGSDGRDLLPDVQRESADRALLVVTESDHALDQGSAINFFVEEGRVRFDIALQPASPHALKISSRLLAVARRVYSTPQGSEAAAEPDLRYARVATRQRGRGA